MSEVASCALCGMRLLTVHRPSMLEVGGELLPFCPDASGCRRRAAREQARHAEYVSAVERLLKACDRGDDHTITVEAGRVRAALGDGSE